MNPLGPLVMRPMGLNPRAMMKHSALVSLEAAGLWMLKSSKNMFTCLYMGASESLEKALHTNRPSGSSTDAHTLMAARIRHDWTYASVSWSPLTSGAPSHDTIWARLLSAREAFANILNEQILDVLHNLLVRDVSLYDLDSLHRRHVLQVHRYDHGLHRAAVLEPGANRLLLGDRLRGVLVDEVLVVHEVAYALRPAPGRRAEIHHVPDARKAGAVVYLSPGFANVEFVDAAQVLVWAAVLALGITEQLHDRVYSSNRMENSVRLENVEQFVGASSAVTILLGFAIVNVPILLGGVSHLRNRIVCTG
ncbi:hypothetical protein BBBOND_0106940 [Babesia bigemina]|uniref:Uncharacterized protein n=1 Tax=Babesia bigemina TaxID=5866 RepID=A0A061D9J0_BABBI|nr:hypothetical protein BBBOND_0106940 [Babesia bigemina]CDR94385.1 hypothetical protein BBBOND_0106940 [Babesia bigemina]|eukprot:XP_012766571.1 hypothetical protein BBBOND_0106940 [Babesia bigemina]